MAQTQQFSDLLQDAKSTLQELHDNHYNLHCLDGKVVCHCQKQEQLESAAHTILGFVQQLVENGYFDPEIMGAVFSIMGSALSEPYLEVQNVSKEDYVKELQNLSSMPVKMLLRDGHVEGELYDVYHYNALQLAQKAIQNTLAAEQKTKEQEQHNVQ